MCSLSQIRCNVKMPANINKCSVLHNEFCAMADRTRHLILTDFHLKVLWRRGVILGLCSQNSPVVWARYPVGPHRLRVMTRDRGLD